MKRSAWVLGVAIIIAAGVFAFSAIAIPHSRAATTPAPFIACSSDADCAVGGTTFNPTSNGINTTVCYYPGTTASYCGTPLSPGDSLPACSFPSSTFNQSGYAAIAVACQAKFGATYDACVANHQGLDCAYTDQSLAFNCGMPGAGQGGPGYCIPGALVPGCIATMTETQLATALGASCSDLTPATPAPPTPPAPPATPTKTPSGSTNSITGIQGFNPATGLYTNGTAVQNTYIVLYGYFGATGNEVVIDGNLVVPSYQSTNQLNIPIGAIAVGIHTVVVSSLLLESPESGSASFTVTTSAAGSWATPDALDGPGIETINPAIQNFFSNGGAGSPGASGASGANTTPGAANTTPVANFPVTILVTAASLNVRSAPNTTAPLAGSQTLVQGDTFIASNEVTGQSVTEDGVTTALWWVSSLGNYVWSGGTTVEGSAPASGGPPAPTEKGSPLGAQTTASNPSITYAYVTPPASLPVGGSYYLSIEGVFDNSGNTVSFNGQSIAVLVQNQSFIEVSLGTTAPSQSFTVTVSDSHGTSPAYTSTTIAPPVLSSVQGYNPTTNQYEKTINIVNPGDADLILYGSFASSTSGYIVIMNNQIDLPITYQGSKQINVSLAGIAAASSPFTVEVSNPGVGVSATVQVGVGAGASISTQTMSVSIPAILAQLRAASSLAGALNIVQNAGLTILGGVTDQDGDVSYLVTTPNGTFVAAIGDYDASTAVGAPTLDGYVYNNTADASSDEFLCKANIGSATAAVNTFPNGKVYGLANATNYSVSIDCPSGSNPSGISCSTTESAANGAAATISAAGAPPVVSNSSVATINVIWENSLIDNDASVLAQSIPIVLVDGTSVCNIDLSTPSLGSEYAAQVAKGNNGFLQQVITHEMGHCMGLSHASTPNSVMYYDASSQPAGATFTSDDKAVLADLRSNTNIPVTCTSANLLGWSCENPTQILLQSPGTNAYSCQSCPDGQLPIANAQGAVSCQSCPTGNFYQEVTTNSDGSLSIRNECNDSCSTTGLYNVVGLNCVSSCGMNQVASENGYQCECEPGTTYDMHSAKCVEGGSLSSPGGDCNSGFLSSSGQCYATSNGTSTSNLCFELSDGTTQCSCADGYDQEGNSCVPTESSTEPPSEGGAGYTCASDGSCIAVENGATYPADDSTCSDACVAEASYPQYSCESSVCTYTGQGPNYSDPSCNGGCSGE